MKSTQILTIAFISSSLLCLSCNNKKENQKEKKSDLTEISTKQKQARVEAILLKRQPFNYEIVSNGKLSAVRKADLNFKAHEIVSKIYVHNGDRVRKGDKIAQLDTFEISQNLIKSKEALQNAQLELRSVLIGQGYSTKDLSEVPANILNLAKVKSRYQQNEVQYNLMKRKMQEATLVAPFSGVIANLNAKEYNYTNTSNAFCKLIDNQQMQVSFNVLESELSQINRNDEVEITPYVNNKKIYKGKVTAINPMVDESGMVKITATIFGANKLFDGMNVRISVLRAIPNCLVIPKSAVVLRTGKKVVFTCKNGKAMWNYVKTLQENMDSYSVVERDESQVNVVGLAENDSVIISGNIDLAHESPIKVIR